MLRYDIRTGVKKIKTKTFMAISGVTLGTAGLAMAVAMPLAAKAASQIVVTPTNTQGWATQDGVPTYVSGPSGADGVGSLQFMTGDPSPAKENYFHATNTPLSDVSDLGYRVDVTSGVPASYQLQVFGVHRTDSDSTFTSLVWEPVYNGQVNGPNSGFVTESNLENGTWWSSHPIDGADYVGGSPTYVSLSAIQAANPNATIVAFGINVGSGTPNATSYVDDVAFGGSTYNFEPFSIVADKDACKNGGWSDQVDSNGNHFKNQGDCVSFVATGGRNTASTKVH